MTTTKTRPMNIEEIKESMNQRIDEFKRTVMDDLDGIVVVVADNKEENE